MAVVLDLKNPTVVLVGHWNAAILNEPGWIARHLLGIPEGQQAQLQAIIIGNEVAPGQLAPDRQVWMFERFGLCCNGQRLEFYLRDMDDFTAVYSTMDRIANLLPHTPVNGLGVNFNYAVHDDIAGITAVLETGEALDGVGAILAQDRTEKIQLPDVDLIEIPGLETNVTVLNLTRRTDFSTVDIVLNYHLEFSSLAKLTNWTQTNPVQHWLTHASQLMSTIYNIDESEVTFF